MIELPISMYLLLLCCFFLADARRVLNNLLNQFRLLFIISLCAVNTDYIALWLKLPSTGFIFITVVNYVSVDRRGGHIGLPLSAQFVRVSEGISQQFLSCRRRPPQQTRDVDPMLG